MLKEFIGNIVDERMERVEELILDVPQNVVEKLQGFKKAKQGSDERRIKLHELQEWENKLKAKAKHLSKKRKRIDGLEQQLEKDRNKQLTKLTKLKKKKLFMIKLST